MTEAKIHHFNGSTVDAEGEILLGYYYQIHDKFDMPLGIKMGPYNSGPEAEAACQKAFDTDDY